MSRCKSCGALQRLTRYQEQRLENPENKELCHRCMQENCNHDNTTYTPSGMEYCKVCGVNPNFEP